LADSAANDADDEADSAPTDSGAGDTHKGKSGSSVSKGQRAKEGEEHGASAESGQDSSNGAPSTTATSAKKRKPKVVDDDENRNGDGQATTPRYQSNRAAALVAKTKLNSRGPKSPEEEIPPQGSLPINSSTPKTNVDDETAALQWVACDRCGKWRSMPSHVDIDMLPEEWECALNPDERYNDCSIEEEPADDENGSMEEFEDNEDLEVLGSDGEVGGRRNGIRTGHSPRGGVSTSVEKVNWVQCNKCTKWRKVPGVIDVDSLPDVWQCSMNTWAPTFARCSVKEESDDTSEQNDGRQGQSSLMRGRRPMGMPHAGNMSMNQGSAHKKVIQWVQCERRNCKKWRKLPGHVDMSLLPEKWYCEMNEWDLDRASCEAPECSDSEGEQTRAPGETRSQLMMANPKGGGSLSYRRIIFGTDGRIRPAYNEKNKNGFGLFSYTDMNRGGDSDKEDEGVVVEPTRRISYWWSSAYDESGTNFVTSQSQHPSSAGGSGDMVDEAENKKSSENSKLMKDRPVHHLLRAARRLGGIESQYGTVFPKTMLKHDRLIENRTMMEIEKAESTVIRSLLQSSSTLSLSLSALMSVIRSSYFHAPELESCRARLTVEGAKAVIQRLESQGEVDVTFKRNGELVVQANPLPPQQMELVASSAADWWKRPTAPLKMRKILQRARDSLNRQTEETAGSNPEGTIGINKTTATTSIPISVAGSS